MREALARGVLAGFCVRSASVVLALLLTAVLARTLGPEAYGIYAFSLSVAMLVTVPAHIGLPTLIVKVVAVAHETQRWRLLRGILLWGNRTTILAAAGVAAVSSLVTWAVSGESTEQFRTQVWAFALVPFIALAGVRAGALRGLNRVVLGQLPEFVIRPGALLALLAVASLAGEIHAEQAMRFHFVAGAVAFVAGAWMLSRVLPIELRDVKPEFASHEWMRSLWPLALLAAVQMINRHTDVVMLGLLAGPEAAGIYSVVAQGALLVSFMLTVINSVIAPYLARLHATHDHARLQRAAAWAASVSLAAAIPFTVALVVFGDAILGLVFGKDFIAGYQALVILCVGQTLNAAAGPVVLLLNMTGNEKDTMWGVAAAALVNVGLDLVLIPSFGINGAAVAASVSLVLWSVLLSVSVYRRIGIVSAPMMSRRLISGPTI